uniref:Odorant receptor n=1 Tax=Aulacocentrum confusum TaxID=2767324 RepID=A0A7G8Z956_9HYME|nr:olfactory receptor 37 [Aulacocentrum confusum]
MTGDKLSEYLIFRSSVKRVLLIVGLWPKENPSIFYRFLPLLQLTLNFSTVLASAGFVRLHINNMNRAIKGISVIISFTGNVLKSLCLLLNRQNAKKLHDILDSKFFKLLDKPDLSNVILDEVTIFRRLASLMTSLTYVSCFIYITRPIITIIYQQLQHIHPIRYGLVLPGVYPWKIVPNGLLYKMHYVLGAMSAILAFAVTTGLDLLFSLDVFQLMAQFRDMSRRIGKINAKNGDIEALQQCVIQYEILIQCRDILQKIYGPILLWTMIVNAGTLCCQMFEFVKMSEISAQRAIFAFVYILFKLLETFHYAWVGSRLTEETEKYKAAIYACNWHGNKRFMSSMVIMLGQKPWILTACNFSNISINIFTNVLNTALSYFFLLKTVQDKNI